MKDLLDKISSYNLFNYLLPGILFVVILGKLTPYSLVQDSLVVGVFVYYFIGLVVSRLGSLIIEPAFKRVGFVKFADYSKYVSAAKVDPKLDLLSENNNMYRTFAGLFLALLMLKVYESLTLKLGILQGRGSLVLVVVLLVMFVFAYRKQTAYITKRIAATKL